MSGRNPDAGGWTGDQKGEGDQIPVAGFSLFELSRMFSLLAVPIFPCDGKWTENGRSEKGNSKEIIRKSGQKLKGLFKLP